MFKNITLTITLLIIASSAIFIASKNDEVQKDIQIREQERPQYELVIPDTVKWDQIQLESKVFTEPAKVETQEVKIEEPKPEVVAPQAIETLPNLAERYNTFKEYYTADSTCHPYIIAAIHYRETNFGNTNAWNGQGAFQNLSNRYEPNSVVTDWDAQVKQACLHLKGKVKAQSLTDLNDEELIGTALARYNGCRGLLYRQCSYVVNKTQYMSSGTKCAVDGCAYTTVDNRFGALAIINQLKALGL